MHRSPKERKKKMPEAEDGGGEQIAVAAGVAAGEGGGEFSYQTLKILSPAWHLFLILTVNPTHKRCTSVIAARNAMWLAGAV